MGEEPFEVVGGKGHGMGGRRANGNIFLNRKKKKKLIIGERERGRKGVL